MNLLLKIILIFLSIFLSIFLLIKSLGIFSVDDVKLWFEALKTQPSYVLGGLVSALLFVDLLLSVPTMLTVLLAGYFLGFFLGAVYALLGLAMASFTGYFLSRKYGERGLGFISNDEVQIKQMKAIFEEYGVGIIVFSRAVPMLPEISSALAGLSKMPLKKFFVAWLFSSLPYVLVLTYAGSLSELDNPTPALVAVGSLTFLLWIVWFVKIKQNQNDIISKK